MSLHTHLYVKTCAATEPGITANVRCCGTLVLALLLTQLLPDATCVSHQRTAKSFCHAYCPDFRAYCPSLVMPSPITPPPAHPSRSAVRKAAWVIPRRNGNFILEAARLKHRGGWPGLWPENRRKMSKMDNQVIRNKGSLQQKDVNRIMFVLTAVDNKFWEFEGRQMMTTAPKMRTNDCEGHGHPSAE